MKANRWTALCENAVLILLGFSRCHPRELIGIEGGRLAASDVHIDTDDAFGVVEPRVPDRRETIPRVAFPPSTDDDVTRLTNAGVDDEPIELTDASIVEV